MSKRERERGRKTQMWKLVLREQRGGKRKHIKSFIFTMPSNDVKKEE